VAIAFRSASEVRDARPVNDALRALFITGLDGSGKTRLRRYLEESPGISLVRRAELWTAPHARHSPVGPGASERCFDALLERPAVRAMVVDEGAVRVALRGGDLSHADLYDLLYRQHAGSAATPRSGEQDSQLERVGDALLDALPFAQVIHLIPHPLARHVGLRRGAWRRLGLIGSTVAAWQASVRRASAHARRHPSRYLVVPTAALAQRERVGRLLQAIGAGDLEPRALLSNDTAPPASGSDAAFLARVAAAELQWIGYASSPGPVGRQRHRAGRSAHGVAARLRYSIATRRIGPLPEPHEDHQWI
jgi:hypothetical protein